MEQAMYLEIRSRFPQPLETYKHVYTRIEAAKKDIEAWVAANPINGDEKVAVVAHSMTFRFWIAEDSYWQRPDAFEQTPPPEVSYNVRNCEFYPDSKNFSR